MKLKFVFLLSAFAGWSLAARVTDMSAVAILDRDPKELLVLAAQIEAPTVNDPSLKMSLTETYVQSASSTKSSNMYSKLIPCLRRNRHAAGKNIDSLSVPADAEAHYKDLLEKTKIFRNQPVHSWASFKGPWIG